jgi:hypothetical protein
MVTLISVILKLEKHTPARYVAVGLDLAMMTITLILRLTFGKKSFPLNFGPTWSFLVDEYGENA